MLPQGAAGCAHPDVFDDEHHLAGHAHSHPERARQYGQAHLEAAQGVLSGRIAALGAAQDQAEEEQQAETSENPSMEEIVEEAEETKIEE